MSSLTIESLYGMEPEASQMQSKQFDLILQNMKYCLQNGDSKHQGWLKNFIQDTVTNLPDDRIKSLQDDKVKDFYNNRLAVVYLGRAFDNMTGQGAPTVKLNDEQHRRLALYLAAGMMKEPGFALQNAQLLKDTYKNCTDVEDYINDASKKWGSLLLKKLYSEKSNLLGIMKSSPAEGNRRLSTQLIKLKMLGMDKEANVFYKVLLHNHALSAIELVENSDHLWQTGIEAFIKAMEMGDAATKVLDAQSHANALAVKKELEELIKQMGSIEALAKRITSFVGASTSPKIWSWLDNLSKAMPAKELEKANALGWGAISNGTTRAEGMFKILGAKTGMGVIKSLRFFAIMGGVAAPVYFILKLDKNDPKYAEKKAQYALQITAGICQVMPEYLIPAAGRFLKGSFLKIQRNLFSPKFESWTVVDGLNDDIRFLEARDLQSRVKWYEEVFCATRRELLEEIKKTVPMTAEEESAFTLEISEMDVQLRADMGIEGFWGREVGALVDTETGSFKGLSEVEWGIAEARFKVFFKGVGFLVATGLAIMSVIDFVADFKNDKSTEKKVLDGLSMGISISFAACALADTVITGMGITSAAATAVPVIGVLLALGGLAIAIVTMANEKKPQSPVDTFMNETLIPAFGSNGFIKELDASTKDWQVDKPVPTVNPYSPAKDGGKKTVKSQLAMA